MTWYSLLCSGLMSFGIRGWRHKSQLGALWSRPLRRRRGLDQPCLFQQFPGRLPNNGIDLARTLAARGGVMADAAGKDARQRRVELRLADPH